MVQASLLSAPASPETVTVPLDEHILGLIARYSGPQLPNYQTGEILGGFIQRHGPDNVMAICHQAFEVHQGMWRGAPVTIQRFQRHHDDFFAIPLLEEALGQRGRDV